MFKIEVFNAPTTWFGPSKYTSLKTTLQNAAQIENEDVTWSPQYNTLATRTNKRRALSLQEVESNRWYLNLHFVLETCTIWFMHKCSMSLTFHFYILGLTSWIWTNPSTEELKFESLSKWNSCGLQSWTLPCSPPLLFVALEIFQLNFGKT